MVSWGRLAGRPRRGPWVETFPTSNDEIGDCYEDGAAIVHTLSADGVSGLYGHLGESFGMVVFRGESDIADLKAETEKVLADKLKRMTPRGDVADEARSNAITADLRILPILRDVAQARWRSCAECAAECREIEFEDWPLENAKSACVLLQDLRRAGKCYLSSHETWVHKSGSS